MRKTRDTRDAATTGVQIDREIVVVLRGREWDNRRQK